MGPGVLGEREGRWRGALKAKRIDEGWWQMPVHGEHWRQDGAGGWAGGQDQWGGSVQWS